MNQRPECAVKGCVSEAFIAYNQTWICGNCMAKIIEKEKQRKDEIMEDLGCQ